MTAEIDALYRVAAEGPLVANRARAAAARGDPTRAVAALWTWRRRLGVALMRSARACRCEEDSRLVEAALGLLIAGGAAEDEAQRLAAAKGPRA